VERVFAAGVVEESEDAARGQGCAAEFPAYLHVLQRQGARAATRGCDQLSERAIEGAALRADAPGRDHQAHGRGDRCQGRRSPPRPGGPDARAADPRPAFALDDAVKVGAIAPDLPLPMDKLAWMQAQMVELGQIPKAGDLAKMVDTDIRAQAAERAGR